MQTKASLWGFPHTTCAKKKAKNKFGTSLQKQPEKVRCQACGERFRVPGSTEPFVVTVASTCSRYKCPTCKGSVESTAVEGDNVHVAHKSPQGKLCGAQFRARNGEDFK